VAGDVGQDLTVREDTRSRLVVIFIEGEGHRCGPDGAGTAGGAPGRETALGVEAECERGTLKRWWGDKREVLGSESVLDAPTGGRLISSQNRSAGRLAGAAARGRLRAF